MKKQEKSLEVAEVPAPVQEAPKQLTPIQRFQQNIEQH
jgi:hypothetical protein